jgi:hypothetical protein
MSVRYSPGEMMEPQIWSKCSDKFAYILMLRGHEVHRLKVTGISLTLKRKVQGIVEALQQGQDPGGVGAKSVETLDARTIAKAEVSPGKGSLTLHGEGENAKKLTYATGDSDADQILQAILAQSGRTYQPTQEEIGVIEALIPPAITGALGGLFWMGIYDPARRLAAGEHVEAKGRRRGLQQMAITVAELLGTNGTIALGVLLLMLILGWAAMRIIRRPERTVWLPENAAAGPAGMSSS